MVRPLYDIGPVVQNFRAMIRPSLIGNLARIEPLIASLAGEAVTLWMMETVEAALSSTEIKSRRGDLANQLRTGIRVTGKSSLRTMAGRIWTQPWVFPHEYGAHITPKNSPFLAIPFGYALHPDGRPKFRSPASWKRYGSFILTHKSDGRRFIVYKSGDTLKYLYVLVDHVDIPARLGLNRMGNQRLGILLAELGQIYVSVARQFSEIEIYKGVVR